MRTDVKTLLGRLGRSQFRYKEFADRFSELETWPVFESVMRDPRVFESPVINAVSAQEPPRPESNPIASALSRKYGEPAAPSNPQATDGDVRSLLARISAAASNGLL